MKLWIANLPPDTTDDALRGLMAKYAPDIECGDIQRVPGDGSRPGALLACPGAKLVDLGRLALRLDGLYWNGRTLAATTMGH